MQIDDDKDNNANDPHAPPSASSSSSSSWSPRRAARRARQLARLPERLVLCVDIAAEMGQGWARPGDGTTRLAVVKLLLEVRGVALDCVCVHAKGRSRGQSSHR